MPAQSSRATQPVHMPPRNSMVGVMLSVQRMLKISASPPATDTTSPKPFPNSARAKAETCEIVPRAGSASLLQRFGRSARGRHRGRSLRYDRSELWSYPLALAPPLRLNAARSSTGDPGRQRTAQSPMPLHRLPGPPSTPIQSGEVLLSSPRWGVQRSAGLAARRSHPLWPRTPIDGEMTGGFISDEYSSSSVSVLIWRSLP